MSMKEFQRRNQQALSKFKDNIKPSQSTEPMPEVNPALELPIDKGDFRWRTCTVELAGYAVTHSDNNVMDEQPQFAGESRYNQERRIFWLPCRRYHWRKGNTMN
jgi:hypothetical protein